LVISGGVIINQSEMDNVIIPEHVIIDIRPPVNATCTSCNALIGQAESLDNW
jgi:hypothetical protein